MQKENWKALFVVRNQEQMKKTKDELIGDMQKSCEENWRKKKMKL